ncbi:MAG: aminopeptidase P family protein [Geminicoccaceae bacterium]|nr:aminopeptidase P family protein [Geminicoccaceae bacterium]
MSLHFDDTEFAARLEKVRDAMDSAGLDGLLLFNQASMFWLTGYDTFGYCFFQSLVVRADGRMILLTRAPDLRQAQLTSIIDDIRIWVDRDGATPADDLRDLLAELELTGKRIGMESETQGLTHANGRRIEAALDGRAELVDASGLVTHLRLVKSPAELAYVRRAGELCDAALDAAIAATGPEADEGVILARMHDAIFEGGGDYPGNPFIIGSGRHALLCRYQSGRLKLGRRDQLTLEWAGVYRQYHAAAMRTLVVGQPDDRHKALHEAARDALLACEEALRPGRSMGEVFDAHARTLDAHGLAAHRLNACGYSLGTVYAPCWMDWPMFYAGNPVIMQPGMVFFLHMIIADSDSNHAMTLGRTSIITETGIEGVSRHPLDMIAC